MWNYKSLSFIMEFPVADALRIIQSPVQQLDESDPSSEIKLSLLESRRGSQVIVSSQHEISHRMIKQFFRKFGEVESCQQSAASEYSVILTFKNCSVAANLCSRSEYTLAPSLTVSVQLFADALAKGEPSAATSTSFSLDFGSIGSSLTVRRRSWSGPADHLTKGSLPRSLRLETPPISANSNSELSRNSEDNDSLLMEESVQPNSPSNAIAKPLYSVPRVVLHSCMRINNSIIRLVRGDPCEHVADVLVQRRVGGHMWKSFLRKWNQHAEQVRYLQLLEAPKIGHVQVATAAKLPVTYVFGLKYLELADGVKGTEHLVKLCLRHCTFLKVRSIAFPAVGTGIFGGNVRVMAKTLMSAIVDYMKLNAQSTLEIIDVVVIDDAMLKDYAAAMKLAKASAYSSSLTSFFSKVGHNRN